MGDAIFCADRRQTDLPDCHRKIKTLELTNLRETDCSEIVPLHVRGNSSLLYRAFCNLIENADAKKALVFEPFYCVDKSRSRQSGGTVMEVDLPNATA